MPFVNFFKIDEFNNFESLNFKLNEIYSDLFENGNNLTHEGKLLFFVLEEGNSQEIIRLSQIQTAEYQIFKKLKEKMYAAIKYRNSLNFEPFESYKEEIETLIKSSKINIKIDFFLHVGSISFKYLKENSKNDDNYFCNEKFASFLMIILYCLENKEEITPKIIRKMIDLEEIPNYNFNKTSENESKNYTKKILNISFKNKIRKIYVYIPICIPGFGKTFFGEILKKVLEDKGEKLNIISSDKLRNECMRKLARKREVKK